MQEAKKDALALSRYFVSLPHPAKTTLAIFAVSFLFGVLFGAARGAPLDPVSMIAGGTEGMLILAFPAVLSALLLYLLRKKAVFRRASFLGLLAVACYGVFYLAAFAFEDYLPIAANLVFVGFGAAFCLWYFILFLAFDFRKSALLFAAMQLCIFAVFFLARPGFCADSDPADVLAKVGFASLMLAAALYLMFYVISAPMKKNLGISSMDAISMFLSQWLYGEKDLEGVFEEIGEEIETTVFVGRFAGKAREALFVVPNIHYGPFGNLGGSEFTSMISGALAKEGRDVFVFHGTATHDFNPVSSSEIGKVVAACRKALLNAKLSAAKLSIESCRVGSVRARLMALGEGALLSFTRAPNTTEDVNFGLGLAIAEKAKREYSCVAVVDEHNAETGDISSVEMGSPIGFEMLDAAQRLFERKAKGKGFRLGAASAELALGTLGKNGLKLALFERGKKLDALLLCDSNSVTPQFREELLSLLDALGREKGYRCTGEVMTTDTHQINSVKGVLNPLGIEGRGEIALAVRRLFYEASGRLEEVRFGCASERFRVNVFGSGQSIEIASTINAVVAVMKLALPLIIVGSILVLLWALSKM